MALTTAEENRLAAIENDLAQLIETVELNMTTKTEFRQTTLLLERAVQQLERAITSGDIDDVVDLYSQLVTWRDAYLGHTDHPPPTA